MDAGPLSDFPGALLPLGYPLEPSFRLRDLSGAKDPRHPAFDRLIGKTEDVADENNGT